MQPFLYGAGITTLYIIVAVGIMLLMRKCMTIPDELFRKTLHFILLGAYIPLVFAFECWWMAAVFALALMAILFPALFFAQRIPMFPAFMNERKKGEFKSSMVLAVGMMAFSVTVAKSIYLNKNEGGPLQERTASLICTFPPAKVVNRKTQNSIEHIQSGP